MTDNQNKIETLDCFFVQSKEAAERQAMLALEKQLKLNQARVPDEEIIQKMRLS